MLTWLSKKDARWAVALVAIGTLVLTLLAWVAGKKTKHVTAAELARNKQQQRRLQRRLEEQSSEARQAGADAAAAAAGAEDAEARERLRRLKTEDTSITRRLRAQTGRSDEDFARNFNRGPHRHAAGGG